jgi:hypothetical protein
MPGAICTPEQAVLVDVEVLPPLVVDELVLPEDVELVDVDVDPLDDVEPPDDFVPPELFAPEVLPLLVDPCDVVVLAVGAVTWIDVAASLRGAAATASSAHAALSAMRDRLPCGVEADARRMPARMGEKIRLETKSGIA